MTSLKITDLVRPFDGEGADVVAWLNKLDLVAKLKDVKDLASVIPLFLERSAFSVYNELNETQKKSSEEIKKALTDAFALNAFTAYERFTRRVWCDESVDVYMTDLRKLARIAQISTDVLLMRAFIVGLPPIVSRELRAATKVETLTLKDVVDRARSLMAELVEKPIGLFAANAMQEKTDAPVSKTQAPSRRCYRCGGPHLIKFCDAKSKITCWNCGREGHMSRDCDSGNGPRRVGAPAALQSQE